MKAKVSRSVNVGGLSFSETTNVEEDVAALLDKAVPAAKVGTLTTKTDADTGTATMTAGHGFVTNDLIDVYWTGGSRRRMTATVTGNSVVLDGGVGDDLPASATAITAMKPLVENLSIAYVGLTSVFLASSALGYIALCSGTVTVELERKIKAGGVYQLYPDSGDTNPFDTNLTKIYFSHGSTSAQKMKAAILYG